MKSFLLSMLSLSFLVQPSIAAANSPSVFVGRYKTLSGQNCDRDSGTRAYVSLGAYSKDMSSILVNYYGDEAVMMEIPSQDGRVQSPGSVGFTDTVTVKWPNANTIKVKSRTQGSNYGQKVDYVTEYSLSLEGKKLTVTESTDSRRVEVCEMVKY